MCACSALHRQNESVASVCVHEKHSMHSCCGYRVVHIVTVGLWRAIAGSNNNALS